MLDPYKKDQIMTKPGTDYEKFVQSVFQAILNANVGQKNIDVRRNVVLIGNSGLEREFDIYWEYELAGIVYKTVIECKDYNNPISIDRIDSFIGKLNDFPGIHGLFATRIGYQSGAETYAKDRNIEALIVRPIDPVNDFTSKNGEPIIREVHLDIHLLSKPNITNVQFLLDKKYIEENNIEYNENTNSYLCDPNNIVIENVDNKTSVKLISILEDVQANPESGYGAHKKRIEYTNSFVIYETGLKLKIKGLEISYTVLPPIKSEITIDAMNVFMAVVEYLSTGKKVMVPRK